MKLVNTAMTMAIGMLLVSCAVSAGFPPALKQAQASYLELEVPGKGFACGATKIDDRTAMTAAHCTDSPEGFTISGQEPVDIQLDGHDHAIVVVANELPGKAAKLSHRLPDIGGKLYLWGKPLGVGPLYREGIYAGSAIDPGGTKWLLTSLMVIGGDSGSGVYDANGRLVATVSIGLNGNPFGGMGWMGFQPYAFTAEQWKRVK